MVKFVPDAGSFSGRLLAGLGRLLGLRSETVYSRAILLVTLLLFVVGGLLVGGVWFFLFREFDLADERELRSSALRLQRFFATAATLTPNDAQDLLGRQVIVLSVPPQRVDDFTAAPDGVLIQKSPDGMTSASFLIGQRKGAAAGGTEVVLAGARPVYETGVEVARIFLVGLAIAGGIMLLLILLVVDRTILRRIKLLAEKVEHEKESERLPIQLNFPGDDELAQLARSIEELAVLVQAAEHEYRNVVEDQTESICRFDAAEKVIFSNRAFHSLCARTPGEPQAFLQDCLDLETLYLLRRTLTGLTPSRPATSFTHAVGGAAEDLVWYRSTLRANFNEAGRQVSGQWIAADVNAEVVAQRKLQESQKQLELLSGRLMHLQDEERRRIARDLHDSTAQSLAALEMNMSVLESMGGDESARKLASETRAISRQVCRELRNISYLLHPPLLEEEGLIFAIRWFADGFTRRNGIAVLLNLPPDFPRLSSEVETALFRIVQEALGNVYRHANATKTWVSLSYEGARGVGLEIRDNGDGLPRGFSATRSAGVGLAGMRERVKQLGGTLEVVSSPYGLSLKCRIPEAPLHAASA
jgi:signal transduction histidine kinase